MAESKNITEPDILENTPIKKMKNDLTGERNDNSNKSINDSKKHYENYMFPLSENIHKRQKIIENTNKINSSNINESESKIPINNREFEKNISENKNFNKIYILDGVIMSSETNISDEVKINNITMTNDSTNENVKSKISNKPNDIRNKSFNISSKIINNTNDIFDNDLYKVFDSSHIKFDAKNMRLNMFENNTDINSSLIPNTETNNYVNSFPASPSKKVQLDSLLKMKEEMENLMLTHEVALQDNFQLPEPKIEENSLKGRIRELLHKAFWDILDQELCADPPIYNQALQLFHEIKQELIELLPAQNRALSVKQQLNEKLDPVIVRQLLEHGTLDFREYSNFIIEIMAKFCAPVRDPEIEKLKLITEIVPIYKEIFRVLDLMRLDMANFTLNVAKPYFKKYSIEYERAKFLEILRIQHENGIDGLELTKHWLGRSASILIFKKQDASLNIIPDSIINQKSIKLDLAKNKEEPIVVEPSGIKPDVTDDKLRLANDQNSYENPSFKKSSSTHESESIIDNMSESEIINIVLNQAYLELVTIDLSKEKFPETLLCDFVRFKQILDEFGMLIFVTSALVLASATIVKQLPDDFKTKAKLGMFKMSKLKVNKDYRENAGELYEYLESILNEWLISQSPPLPQLTDVQAKSLRGQIVNALDPQQPINSVCRLMGTRLRDFIYDTLSRTNRNDQLNLPIGYSCVTSELVNASSKFLQLVSYNQNVFGLFYSDIIRDVVRRISRVKQYKEAQTVNEIKGNSETHDINTGKEAQDQNISIEKSVS